MFLSILKLKMPYNYKEIILIKKLSISILEGPSNTFAHSQEQTKMSKRGYGLEQTSKIDKQTRLGLRCRTPFGVCFLSLDPYPLSLVLVPAPCSLSPGAVSFRRVWVRDVVIVILFVIDPCRGEVGS